MTHVPAQMLITGEEETQPREHPAEPSACRPPPDSAPAGASRSFSRPPLIRLVTRVGDCVLALRAVSCGAHLAWPHLDTAPRPLLWVAGPWLPAPRLHSACAMPLGHAGLFPAPRPRSLSALLAPASSWSSMPSPTPLVTPKIFTLVSVSRRSPKPLDAGGQSTPGVPNKVDT